MKNICDGLIRTLGTARKDSVSLETSIEILQNECKEKSDIIVLKREEGQDFSKYFWVDKIQPVTLGYGIPALHAKWCSAI